MMLLVISLLVFVFCMCGIVLVVCVDVKKQETTSSWKSEDNNSEGL